MRQLECRLVGNLEAASLGDQPEVAIAAFRHGPTFDRHFRTDLQCLIDNGLPRELLCLYIEDKGHFLFDAIAKRRPD